MDGQCSGVVVFRCTVVASLQHMFGRYEWHQRSERRRTYSCFRFFSTTLISLVVSLLPHFSCLLLSIDIIFLILKIHNG